MQTSLKVILAIFLLCFVVFISHRNQVVNKMFNFYEYLYLQNVKFLFYFEVKFIFFASIFYTRVKECFCFYTKPLTQKQSC